jgi:hypothetical protein
MICFPPLPSSAYALTSQLHVPKNASVTFTALSPMAPPAVEEDSEDEDEGLYMSSRSTPFKGSVGVKVLDGQHEERGTNHQQEGDYPEEKYKSINDYVYNPPPRQPLNLEILTRTKPPKPRQPLNPWRTKTKGERLAETINFNRSSWVMTAPGLHGEFYPGFEQRNDFINYVDSLEDGKDGGPELCYCRVCGENHIPPGTPITLEDRDTCGAYL